MPVGGREVSGGGRRGVSGRVRLLVSLLIGIAVGVGVSLPGTWRYGVLIGWIAAAAVFLGWMWFSIWPMDAAATARARHHREPGPRGDRGDHAGGGGGQPAGGRACCWPAVGGNESVQAGLSIAAVAAAWASRAHGVHHPLCPALLRRPATGGIDFNQDDPPQYTDFAYLAFTIGMTFQVSDTDLKTKPIRATALRHMLLSYLFGAIIIATTINLVSGLSK